MKYKLKLKIHTDEKTLKCIQEIAYKAGYNKAKKEDLKDLKDLQGAFDVAVKEIVKLRNKLGYDK